MDFGKEVERLLRIAQASPGRRWALDGRDAGLARRSPDSTPNSRPPRAERARAMLRAALRQFVAWTGGDVWKWRCPGLATEGFAGESSRKTGVVIDEIDTTDRF